MRLFEPLPAPVRRAVWWAIALSLVVFLLVATSGRPWARLRSGSVHVGLLRGSGPRRLVHGRLDVPEQHRRHRGLRGRRQDVPVLRDRARDPAGARRRGDGCARRPAHGALAPRRPHRRAASGGQPGLAGPTARARGRARRRTRRVAGLVAVVGVSEPAAVPRRPPGRVPRGRAVGRGAGAGGLRPPDRLVARPDLGGPGRRRRRPPRWPSNTRGSVGLGPVVALGLVLVDRAVRGRTDGGEISWPPPGCRPRPGRRLRAGRTGPGSGPGSRSPFEHQGLSTFGAERQAALEPSPTTRCSRSATCRRRRCTTCARTPSACSGCSRGSASGRART